MIASLFSPRGRISGTQFFSYIAIDMLAMLVIGFGLGTVPSLDAPLVLSVIWALQAWPLACLFIRRLHDTGRSAAWLWLLAPQAAMAVTSLIMGGYMPGFILQVMNAVGIVANLLCWALIFFLALKTGQLDDNRYGPDPHGKRGDFAAKTDEFAR
ncbi:DUF805 domain-containing protein [Asticcacaulis sp. 201]|uniref:DUF805 domain-containing protein n=1 Tax=Asticcacaulis sp. 201 TaxID=3028787 RepID=UPI002915D526|nr:DUF805 domain-containing protein [Asticcacaulis sp. 201]MDV6332602.1 DUF805 domain-containing protein [Asticcacaulis sp. 201]